ncbi:MAG: hypothetical protein AABW90_02485 [Nanoarchaeota archaeon]
MIVKILGILDIITSILFWIFTIFSVKSLESAVLLLGLFLLVKGVVFFSNLSLASLLDIASSIFIIYANSNEIHIIFVIAVSLFLLQKGILSLFG